MTNSLVCHETKKPEQTKNYDNFNFNNDIYLKSRLLYDYGKIYHEDVARGQYVQFKLFCN